MKKIAFLVVGSALLFQMCAKEIGPNILLIKPLGLSDSTFIETNIPAPDAKVVLVEEFSGVRCPNCPKGHAETENLIAAHPNQVIGVTLHVNENRDPLTHPYNFANAQDFQTAEATAIEADFAQYTSMPCALIDRVKFAGESAPAVMNFNNWASDVSTRLAVATPVNLKMTNSWDATTRTIKSRVEVHYTSAVSVTQNISLMIAEDSIVNPQYNAASLKPSKIDTFYTHHHNILRKMITPAGGLPIAYEKSKGRVVIYFFEMANVPTLWKEDYINLIAFVHNSGSSAEVVQSIEKPLY
jgi:hypothetical protein